MRDKKQFISKVDKWNLSYLGIPLLAVFLFPYLVLGTRSIFEINDQLDETLFTYVLNAKYLFTGVKVYPEMLSGVVKEGVTVSAPIFIPLYRIFSYFQAFCIQYAIVAASAFIGMYLCVKELTDSSILAFLMAGMFLFLPYQPVYGLSVVGGPLVAYSLLCLYRKKHVWIDYLILIYFALSAHLVLLGYVVCGFFLLATIYAILTRSGNRYFYCGWIALLGTYILVNISLFKELFLSANQTISHRVEIVNHAAEVFPSIKEVFLNSSQHAFSYHKYLILPIVLIIIIFGILYKRLSEKLKKIYILLCVIMGCNVLIALFYGIYFSEPVVELKNSVSGFLHYFQMQRFYFAYPTLWYLAIALCCYLIVAYFEKISEWIRFAIVILILIPTALLVLKNSIWLLNIRQINAGEQGIDMMTWQDYYAEDVMAQIEDYINQTTGKSQEDYRVASLGMNPATALFSGFYTIDGYSNNYSLEYKHQFREIIAKELEKCEPMRIYFDEWGSRCYLLTKESQNYYYLKKGADFTYQELQLNTEKMKEMGCEYLFAGAEIENPDSMNMTLEGTFSTDSSYYQVWLYRIN